MNFRELTSREERFFAVGLPVIHPDDLVGELQRLRRAWPPHAEMAKRLLVRRYIQRALTQLSPREEQTLRAFFFTRRDLRSIAIEYNLTVERVRQIKEKAIRRLRGPIGNELRALDQALNRFQWPAPKRKGYPDPVKCRCGHAAVARRWIPYWFEREAGRRAGWWVVCTDCGEHGPRSDILLIAIDEWNQWQKPAEPWRRHA